MSHRRICIAHPEHDVAAGIVERAQALGFPSAFVRRYQGGAEGALSDAVSDSSVPIILVTTDVAPDAQHAEGHRADTQHTLADSDGVTILRTPCSERELQLTVEKALARHDARSARETFDDTFFAVSVDMLCFLDFNGHFQRLNASWERTLGYSLDELKSRPFIDFVHPEDRERTLAQNAEVRAGGQALSFENRYVCKDGSVRWFHWNATPNVKGRVIYSVARDVTEVKKAQAEREHLLAELRAALDEVRTLRAIIPMCAHCRRIRDEEDRWHSVEQYIAQNTASRFSHGICPTCVEAFEPQFGNLRQN